MRHDLLLHFLNRHAREIVGLPDRVQPGSAVRVFLTKAFRSAILLSETAAVMPPGFFLESDVGFEIVTQDSEFLDQGLVELPMRELRLGDMIEKKRTEYASARGAFSGLFDDNRLRLLDDLTPSFIDRKTQIGASATDRWVAGPDVDENWKEILAVLTPEAVNVVRHAPRLLREDGAALTWPALIDYLNRESLHHQSPVRLALQQNYFELYIREYSLGMMDQLPYKFDDFIPQGTARQYPFRTFLHLLESLNLSFVLELPARELSLVRMQPAWTRFVDAFTQLAADELVLRANVLNAFGSATGATEVIALGAICNTGQESSRSSRIVGLVDMLGSVADDVASRFQLNVRADHRTVPAEGSFEVHRNRDVAVAPAHLQRRRAMRNVFVVTSNENENRAVLRVLRDAVGGANLVVDASVASPVSSTSTDVDAKAGTIRVEVAIAEETGGANAANLLRRRATAGQTPDAVFVVGCAGLLKEKHDLTGADGGDFPKGLVVLAKRASDGDARLIEDDGVTSRGDAFHGDSRLIESFRTLNANDVFDADGITLVTNREYISTAAFVASKNSEERTRFVEQFLSDAIVVENEAYAVYNEIQNLQSESGRILPCLVVKGISDLGDDEARVGKVQKQQTAAANAMKVVLRLVQAQ